MSYNADNFKKQGGKVWVVGGEINVKGDNYFGNKEDGNYSTFEENGTLVAKGNAGTWKDINIGGVSLTRQQSNRPDLVNVDDTGILTYAFDGGSSKEEAHGAFELQHDYKEGSTLYPHAHFYPTTDDAGDFKIFLEYFFLDKDGDKVTGTTSYIRTTEEIAWKEYVDDFDDVIDGSNLLIGTQMHFKIYRNPSDSDDTYSEDVAIATFGVHYKVDTNGSRGIFEK